VSPG
jgi:phospholipid-translocating ATPase